MDNSFWFESAGNDIIQKTSFCIYNMSNTEGDKEYINIEDVDQEDLFTLEEGTTQGNTGNTTEAPKMTNEEIERYDRLIQVCTFAYCSPNSIGSI